jgi:hypothetical protein
MIECGLFSIKLANLFSMLQETCSTQTERVKTLEIQLASANEKLKVCSLFLLHKMFVSACRTSCVQLAIFGSNILN